MKDVVRIGIIGTGFARKVQMPSFAACENAKVVSVASGSIENAKAAAAEFGVEHFTDDWNETVSRDDVDLVCITTPPVMHRDMAVAALSLGKHVLCEKPMAMSVAEAEEMNDAAKGKNLLALIDHELRFQPGRRKASQMIRSGEIGKVRHAKYLFQAQYRGDPNAPWNWWSDIEQGGGALGAINSHVIDSFNFFLGSKISEVFCQLQTNIKRRRDAEGRERDVTADDQANMLVRFEDGDLTEGATGLVSVSMAEGPSYANRIVLYGTEGALRVDHQGDLYQAKRGEHDWTAIDTGLGEAVEGVADTGFSRGFMEFAPKIVDAVRSGRAEIEGAATFDDGVKVQRVLDAARESNDRGCVVKL
jgi:predicted dehydrogenase